MGKISPSLTLLMYSLARYHSELIAAPDQRAPGEEQRLSQQIAAPMVIVLLSRVKFSHAVKGEEGRKKERAILFSNPYTWGMSSFRPVPILSY